MHVEFRAIVIHTVYRACGREGRTGRAAPRVHSQKPKAGLVSSEEGPQIY